VTDSDSTARSTRGVRTAVAESALLAVACWASFLIVTQLVSRVHSIAATDDDIGGLWAVIATIFVLRGSYEQSVAAAVSRVAGTLVSFAVCVIYLAFLPFHVWALAALIGVSSLVMVLAGRPGDAATAAISTAVLIALADVTRQHVWEQPFLRLADTVIGVLVGVVAAWFARRVIRSPGDEQDRRSDG
jgi:uncharacterized membrane protein YccC